MHSNVLCADNKKPAFRGFFVFAEQSAVAFFGLSRRAEVLAIAAAVAMPATMTASAVVVRVDNATGQKQGHSGQTHEFFHRDILDGVMARSLEQLRTHGDHDL